MSEDRYYNVIGKLNFFLKKAGLSKAAIAREMDMKQPKVNGYFLTEGASQRDMPLSFLADLAAKYPQLDMNWLFRGEEEDYSTVSSSDALAQENARLVAQIGILKNTIRSLSEIISDQNPR